MWDLLLIPGSTTQIASAKLLCIHDAFMWVQYMQGCTCRRLHPPQLVNEISRVYPDIPCPCTWCCDFRGYTWIKWIYRYLVHASPKAGSRIRIRNTWSLMNMKSSIADYYCKIRVCFNIQVCLNTIQQQRHLDKHSPFCQLSDGFDWSCRVLMFRM
jgi:hypothetical protein